MIHSTLPGCPQPFQTLSYDSRQLTNPRRTQKEAGTGGLLRWWTGRIRNLLRRWPCACPACQAGRQKPACQAARQAGTQPYWAPHRALPRLNPGNVLQQESTACREAGGTVNRRQPTREGSPAGGAGVARLEDASAPLQRHAVPRVAAS